jgi:magnesium transporter
VAVIVDQAVYRDGRRQPCADLSDELERLADTPDGFIWIGLKDPTNAEFDLVKQELGLHPLAVEDAVRGNQRAKLEVYDHSLFVVLKPLRYIEETSQIETGEVMLFVGQHFVVTVRRGEAGPLAEVRRRLELNVSNLAYGPGAVLHAVMDDVVDHYGEVDAEIARDLEQMEESVFAGDVEVEAAATGQGRPQNARQRRRGGEDARRI